MMSAITAAFPPRRKRIGGRAQASAALLSPAVGLIAVFVFLPILLTLWLSLQSWSTQTAFSSASWAGLDNYQELFGDDSVGRDFRQALLNTGVYSALSIILIIPLSLAFGLLVHNAGLRGATVLRTILFSTYMVPMVAVAIVWSKLYSPSEGPINQVLELVGLPGRAWLSRPETALYSIVILNVWQQVGYFTVLAVAGLTQLPVSVMEAARIDGAGTITIFFRIMLPLLSRTLLFSAVVALINSVQVFEPVALITEGGPLGSTDVMTYHIRRVGIEWSQGGLGSAMAVVLMLILAAIVVIIFWAARRVAE